MAKLFYTDVNLTSGTATAGATNTRASPAPQGANSPTGQNMVWTKFVAPATISVAGCIALVALPEKAVVLEGVLSGTSKLSGVYSVGLYSKAGPVTAAATYTNATVLISAATVISTNKVFRLNGTVPYQVASITTTSAQRYWTVIAKHVSGTLCKTITLQLGLIYTTAGK